MVAHVTQHVPVCHGTARFALPWEETAVAGFYSKAPSGWGPLAKIAESQMGFAGLVLATVAGSVRFPFHPLLCCRVLYLCLKFWRCTEPKHGLCLFPARFPRGQGTFGMMGRMSLWCLLASQALVSLRVLGWEVFLVLLTQQGANGSSGKAMSGYHLFNGPSWGLERSRW